jgi:hypothetical protein
MCRHVMLPHVCPHTTIYVSPGQLIDAYYVCPYAPICLSSCYSVVALLATYYKKCVSICVRILLYTCPDTSRYVC